MCFYEIFEISNMQDKGPNTKINCSAELKNDLLTAISPDVTNLYLKKPGLVFRK